MADSDKPAGNQHAGECQHTKLKRGVQMSSNPRIICDDEHGNSAHSLVQAPFTLTGR